MTRIKVRQTARHELIRLAPVKLNLGPGAYLDNSGRPWILPSVAMAEEKMREAHPGHEYLPILGLPLFRQVAREVVFGEDSTLLPSIATIQTISGTGAIRIAIQTLKQLHSSTAKVYVSDPSWSNHRVMFEYAGYEVLDYPYYDNSTRSVCFDRMTECLEKAEEGSIIVLHACAHNPTGCDLTREQWTTLAKVLYKRNHLPILDSAYQGFASGSLDDDAWAVRHVFEQGITGIVCQSFSKSMGLYGERVGAMHVVVPGHPEAITAIESQIGWISRKEISTAGRYGATIASLIISNSELYKQWRTDLVTMSSRIQTMRHRVQDGLRERGTPGDWSHITGQIGMFSYTGLSKIQVKKLQEKHVYMSETGRVSMSGLNEGNVDYFCDCVDEVVRH
jgi:aspartate aminotransferase